MEEFEQLNQLRNKMEALEVDMRDLNVQFVNLQTRLQAIELKHDDDKKDLQEQISALNVSMGEVKKLMASLRTLQTANHMAVIHLLGVIAHHVKVPAEELKGL